MSRARKIAKKALLLTFSLTICLGVAEVFLRVKNSSMTNYDIEMWRYARELKKPSDNPTLGHEHVKSTTAMLQSVEIRTSRRGLRGDDAQPPQPNQRRILFLGSSITLGWGVEEKDTTTARLERLLASRDEDVVVFNAGIGNYNTVRYVERYFTQFTDLQPTDIVVHYFVNDAEELHSGGGNWLLRNSQLSVTLYTAVQKYVASQVGGGTLESHYQKVYEPDAPGFIAMQEALKRLSDHAQEKGIRLHLAMVPDVHNLKDYKFQFIHDKMRTISDKYGYAFIDLFPAFEGLDAEEVWAMPGDPHPNSLGHEKMAGALLAPLAIEQVATRKDGPAETR